MANAFPVRLCPGCKAELPDPVPASCPVCDRALEKPPNAHFDPPDYLRLQKDEWDLRFSRYETNAKPPTREELEEKAAVERSWAAWLKAAPVGDRRAALLDAHDLLKTALFCPMLGIELKQLVALGKQLGALAESIDKYMANGGEITHEPGRKTGRLPPIPGDEDGGQTAAP